MKLVSRRNHGLTPKKTPNKRHFTIAANEQSIEGNIDGLTPQ